MNRVASAELWSEIKRLGNRGRKQAAIAYVSTEKGLTFKRNDVLVVDASDRAIRMGETSAQVLARALKRGADLYSLSGLHAKGMVLGDVAVVGSANLSESSQEDLVEAGLISDSPPVVAMMAAFVKELSKQAEPIDRAFIERIKKIHVARKGGRSAHRGTNPRVHLGTSQSWLIGVNVVEGVPRPYQSTFEAKEAEAQDEKKHRSASLSWFTVGRSVCLRLVKPGDTIIGVKWEDGRCTVTPPEVVLVVDRRNSGAMVHTEVYPAGWRTLDRATFRKLLSTTGGPSLGKYPLRALEQRVTDALHALWPRAARRKRRARKTRPRH